MPTTELTKSRILSLLLEHPYRGMRLKRELLKRHGMSDGTRNNCLRALLAERKIARIPAGPGRSAQYRIRKTGVGWLNDFANSPIPELHEKVTESFPITIGQGNIELTYASEEPYFSKKRRLFELAQDPLFNRLVSHLALRQMSGPVTSRVSFELGIKIDTETPVEVRYLLEVVRLARIRRRQWFRERRRLFASFQRAGSLAETDKLLPCILDFFCFCPMGALEYTLIGYTPVTGDTRPYRSELEENVKYCRQDSELYSFALAKWPALPEDLRTKLRKRWNQNYRLYKSFLDGLRRKPKDSTMFDYPLEGRSKRQRRLSYRPDYRLQLIPVNTLSPSMEQRIERDFSDSRAVEIFNRAVDSSAARRWLAHLDQSTKTEEFARNPVQSVAMLVAYDLLTYRCIQWQPRYDETRRSDNLGWEMQDSRLILHLAVRNNCLMCLWEGLFDIDDILLKIFPHLRVPDDSTWFNFWGKVRHEFFSPPQRELLNPYVSKNLHAIDELPTFFRILDRLYVAWLNAKQPRISTRNIESILRESVHIWESSTTKPARHSYYHFSEDMEIRQKRNELMSMISSDLSEFLNELEWPFPI